MTARILLLVLPGLLTFGLGVVILGVRFLEGAPIPAPVVVSAGASGLLGLYLLLRARTVAQARSVVSFTRAGVVFAGMFSLGVVTLLCVSVLHFSNPERGHFFYTGAALLVVASVLISRLLEHLGLPVLQTHKGEG